MNDSRNLAKALAEPLQKAFESSEKTLKWLIEKAGLDIDESGLSRKLRGKTSIGLPDEAEALGKVFGLKLKWDERGKVFRYEPKAA